jgi:hypothetical protein
MSAGADLSELIAGGDHIADGQSRQQRLVAREHPTTVIER